MGSFTPSFKKTFIKTQEDFHMNANHEKLELFKEALLFHCRENLTNAELDWCEWAKERIEQLMAEKCN